jgi:hypothetical protein
MTLKEIAAAFSNGKFELAYPYFAEEIEWIIVGANECKGKKAVIDNCEQTAAYFLSVTTLFTVFNIIGDANRIAINGTAEFIKENKRVAFVDACDVYEFNEKGRLQKIISYCIQQKKQ